MAKATLAIPALNAGEFSPLFDARTDLASYPAGCFKLENYLPLIQGPGQRRAGSKHIMQVKDSSDRTWLVPFIRARSTAYMLEFGDSYVRFYFERQIVVTGSPDTISGATQADPVEITATGHMFSDGDDVFISGVVGMTELNGRWFKVANSATNTFELQDLFGNDVDGTGFTAYTSGGSADKPYEIASPYNAAALTLDNGELGIDYVQSGDVLYITDRRGVLQPRKLSRTSSTSWAFSTLDPDDGPFLDLNDTATTMYISAATGSGVTITASSSVFTASHVGALVRIEQETLTATLPWKTGTSYGAGAYVRSEGHEYQTSAGGTSGTTTPSHTQGTVTDGAVNWTYQTSTYGVARITAQAGTTATVDVIQTFPQTTVGSGNASTLWRLGAWSAAEGYPETVSFFLNRLAFGADDTIDFSVGNLFESFNPDEFGEPVADSAVRVRLLSNQVNKIVGLLAARNALLAFTEGGEWTVKRLTETDPFGPTNVGTNEETAYGSRPVKPIRVGEAALFVTATGRKLRELRYSIEADNLLARDMTVRAEHIMRVGVEWTAWQNEPNKVLWVGRSDGQVLAFSYDRDQDVLGWSRCIMGGAFGSGAAVGESGATLPAPNNDRDDLYVIVKRTINGATKRYVEFIAAEHTEDDDAEDAVYVDSCVTYDGASATTISGFFHVEGQSLTILADGAKQTAKTVSNGAITLDTAASVVQAGLSYRSRYASMRLDGGAGDGSSQGKLERIKDVALRVYESRGGQAGAAETNLSDVQDLNFRAPSTPMGQASPLVTGDVTHRPNTKWTKEPRLWFETSDPFPSTILGFFPQVRVQENRR